MKMAVFQVVSPCSLVEVHRRFRGACRIHNQGLMEAESTSETSGNFYHTTRPKNPEDSHLHITFRYTEMLNKCNFVRLMLQAVQKDDRPDSFKRVAIQPTLYRSK
jgi:hypothetical protein